MTSKLKKRVTIIAIAAGSVLLLVGGFFLFLLADLYYGYESPVAFNYNQSAAAFDDAAFSRISGALDSGNVSYRIEPATVNDVSCNVILIQKVSEEKAAAALESENLFEEYPEITILDRDNGGHVYRADVHQLS